MTWPTVADLKTWLKITGTADDAWLTHKRDFTIDAMERYTDRFLSKGSHVEVLGGTCGCVCNTQLRGIPVESIQSVSGAKDYRFNREGKVCFTCTGDGPVTITYTGGLDPIPMDLLDTFYNMMSAAYANKNVTKTGGGGIKSERVDGVATISYYPASSGDDGGGGNDVESPRYYASVLDLYRRHTC